MTSTVHANQPVNKDVSAEGSHELDEIYPTSYVVKNDGSVQVFQVLKLLHTLKTLSWNLSMSFLDLAVITESVVAGIAPRMTSRELQMHTARTVATYSTKHPDYSTLAARIIVRLIHKTVDESFVNWVNGNALKLHLHPCLLQAVALHGRELDAALVHSRDFETSFLSIGTMIHRYLASDDGVPCERPQFMYMRVAIAIHGTDLPAILETYDALSRRLYTHATPVLYNAGTLNAHYSSCFIYQPDTATVDLLLRGVADVDGLWRAGGGVGLSLAGVPARSPFPRSQPGLLALLRILETHASFLSESGLKRPCATTAYVGIWHYDVRTAMPCRTSRAGMRMKHVFLGLLIPDLFMVRLKAGQKWSLFDPIDVPDLLTTYGEDFTYKYEQYESSDIMRATVDAATLYGQVCTTQRETGTPFIIFLDAMNYKNNQSHLGIILSSNLCTEIVQYCSERQPAVCTLASVALPRFLKTDNTFDFERLHAAVKLAVRNTDALIDLGEYPDQLTRQSALRSRSIGIGAQGFADCLRARRFPFHSPEARWFNKLVYETIYHAALDASCDLARLRGPHPTWLGSPASLGVTQDVMWGVTPSNLYDWHILRERIGKFGLRNAMLTAQMPTASTACLLGNYEGTEIPTSNITNRRVFSGDYVQWCPWLVRELVANNLWSEELRAAIVRNHGSVAGVAGVPHFIKEVFKTAWEIDPKDVLNMAADRAPFIDQSQSTTLHMAWPTTASLRDLHFHAWESGLKTGIYYLRSRAPTFALPFGVPGDYAVNVPQGSSLSYAFGSTAIQHDSATVHTGPGSMTVDEQGTPVTEPPSSPATTSSSVGVAEPLSLADVAAHLPMSQSPDTASTDTVHMSSTPPSCDSVSQTDHEHDHIADVDDMYTVLPVHEHLSAVHGALASFADLFPSDAGPSVHSGIGMYTDLPMIAEDLEATCDGCSG